MSDEKIILVNFDFFQHTVPEAQNKGRLLKQLRGVADICERKNIVFTQQSIWWPLCTEI